MNHVIYKYPVHMKVTPLTLPSVGTLRFLRVEMQDGVPTLWVMHAHPDQAPGTGKSWWIYRIPTGMTLQPEFAAFSYLGTLFDQELVWHYFAELKG